MDRDLFHSSETCTVPALLCLTIIWLNLIVQKFWFINSEHLCIALPVSPLCIALRGFPKYFVMCMWCPWLRNTDPEEGCSEWMAKPLKRNDIALCMQKKEQVHVESWTDGFCGQPNLK